VRPFFEWFESSVRADDPWLILGKGPSFRLRGQYDLTAYRTLGLNHVVREQPVLVAHVIDLDVVGACATDIENQAQFLVMPWYPHVDNRPGARPLDALVRTHPVLARLSAAGRLLWYDLNTSPIRHGGGPTVEATFFSAEAALSLLALAGARTIRSLGVDGGATYSPDFRDLVDRTLLRNGNPHFDLQFEGFARTIARTGVDFGALNLASPVRVYVAADEGDRLPLAVLEHSLRARASLSTAWPPLSPGAPLPVPVGGLGLIAPPGALFLSDVRRLWTLPVDSSEARLWLDAGAPDRVELALLGAEALGAVAEAAGAVRDGASPARLRSVLPSSVRVVVAATPAGFASFAPDGRGPWRATTHPLGHLWTAELLDAVAAGAVSREWVADEVHAGWVRPSLLHQIDHGLVEPLLLPRSVRLLDGAHQSTGGGPGPDDSWSARQLGMLRALTRELGRRVREYRVARGIRLHAAERARAAAERGGAPA